MKEESQDICLTIENGAMLKNKIEQKRLIKVEKSKCQFEKEHINERRNALQKDLSKA